MGVDVWAQQTFFLAHIRLFRSLIFLTGEAMLFFLDLIFLGEKKVTTTASSL